MPVTVLVGSREDVVAQTLTVDTIVVTMLPQRLKMAKKPTTNSAAVKQMAMT